MAMGLLVAGLSMSAWANIDTYQFDNPRQEAQYRALIEEFRCPKCQNQNLAGSDAPIAQDLKQKTYDMVKDGRSDAEIRQYMNERYGDFIFYRPRLRAETILLWFGPLIFLLIGAGVAFVIWRRARDLDATSDNLDANDEERLKAILNEKP